MLWEGGVFDDQATLWNSTTGRCLRPSMNFKTKVSQVPRLPMTSL